MTRFSASITLALLAAHAVAADPAFAADKAPPVDPRLQAEFTATDLNKDGTLSRAEIRARVAHMDAGAAQLSQAQATAYADRLFTMADTNKDNKLTPVEMQALFRTMAQRYDTNHDGVVSLAERQAARRAVTEQAKGR